MALFGKKDNKKDESQTPAKRVLETYEDQAAGATPKQAVYFTSFRTDAYLNQNGVSDFVEFWAATQIAAGEDKWRLMRYMISGLDREEGDLTAELAHREDLSFLEAIAKIAQFDLMAKSLGTHKPFDLREEEYTASDYPELKTYYYAVENYRLVANIEGLAFDKANKIYRRVEGKVVVGGIFSREEIANSLTAAETARDNPRVQARMEQGILSDLFTAAADKNSSLERFLTVRQSLGLMDQFALNMCAFYLSVQKDLKLDDGLSEIQALPEEAKKEIAQRAKFSADKNSREVLLKSASFKLSEAKAQGAYVEPFEKHLKECELYNLLLTVVLERQRLTQNTRLPYSDVSASIASIQESVRVAKEKFIELGGREENYDRLQAWVSTDQSKHVPPFMVAWINRYYDVRARVMKKLDERENALRGQDLAVMATEVKPPLL